LQLKAEFWEPAPLHTMVGSEVRAFFLLAKGTNTRKPERQRQRERETKNEKKTKTKKKNKKTKNKTMEQWI